MRLLVEDVRIEVHSVRPSDRPRLVVHAYLREEGIVSKGDGHGAELGPRLTGCVIRFARDGPLRTPAATRESALVGPGRKPQIQAMEPVDPIVQAMQTRRFREMSAERKLQLADELLALARALKESSLRKLYPDLSEAALRARVTELFANVPG